MEVIDLTHIMNGDMPVFPGTEKPVFFQANTLEKDGFAETKFFMYSHTGTHIDAPAHMVAGTNSLDKLGAEHFIGKAVIIDCSSLGKLEIEAEDLAGYEERLREVDFIIIKTNWSSYWGSARYFDRFPFLTAEAAKWLTGFNLKGIGVDAISIDDMETKNFPVHNILFSNNMIVIENLTNLDSVKEEIFMLSCLPLKYEMADGSPVRAVAIESLF